MGPEAKIEDASCRAAIARGWMVMKFTSPGRRSVPDRIFFRDGRCVLIEFKAPKEPLTSGQKREIARLRSKLMPVAVCRSKAEAIEFLEAHE